jgi:hypothetical protein
VKRFGKTRLVSMRAKRGEYVALVQKCKFFKSKLLLLVNSIHLCTLSQTIQEKMKQAQTFNNVFVLLFNQTIRLAQEGAAYHRFEMFA